MATGRPHRYEHQHRPYAIDGPCRTGVVILAAGHGERFGRGPKSAIELAGRPLIDHVVAAMTANRSIAEIVVTAPTEFIVETERMLRAAGSPVPAHVVSGGVTRQASVRAGLAALPPEVNWVAITDVARPLVPRGTVDRLIAALCDADASARAQSSAQPCGAVPVVSVVDSLHLIADDRPLLGGPVDRERLRAAQTPQFFHRSCIVDAHEAAAQDGATCTDDVGAMTRIGVAVVPVPGVATNIKITFAEDLGLAEALYARSSATTATLHGTTRHDAAAPQ